MDIVTLWFCATNTINLENLQLFCQPAEFNHTHRVLVTHRPMCYKHAGQMDDSVK
uniref:Uncharacterized protein n=1 Tax=Arion vulgaris TaxID=1028688 RepID=A0A0B7AYU1_9EUPU